MKKATTINELSEQFGISKRRIRYFVEKGFLPPPAGRGRGGLYDERHEVLLKAISYYEARGEGLGAIKDILSDPMALEQFWRKYFSMKGTAGKFEDWLGNLCRERITPAAGTYRRYRLADGIELHIRGILYKQNTEKIEQLFKTAEKIFNNGN